MKNFGFLLVALLTLVSVATGCSKATVLDDVGAVRTEERMALTAMELDSLMVQVDSTGLFDREALAALVCDEEKMSTWTVDEKVRYLNGIRKPETVNRTAQDAALETIAKRQYGNPNINGGLAVWDATADILTLTIASMGTTGDPRAPINYHNQSNGVINWNDASRAANGYFNQSVLTDTAIEITNIEYLYPVSGDGNWLIGASVTVAGVTTVYDAVNPLIYDPVPGGVTIVGPMPGGFVEVIGNGTWPVPPSIDF